ncbi:hypothetical protein WDZ17_12910 [Pseudokineococcus basanitobsidens]|uniref:Uncharacterized protein n=1 Tax=Pseudokineococcus basanitobsidens TaxID=1926649 RepID=A0ABU8RM57_9ACTN
MTRARSAAAAAGGAVLGRVRGVPRDDRGDVPGWVMVTLMTAGLVVALWAVAGPRLQQVFTTAMDRVLSGG